MVIFLDIDGVMIPSKSWERQDVQPDGLALFHPKAVGVLNYFITSTTTILLTTSHKDRFTIQEWEAIFETRGLKKVRVQSLASNENNLSRKEELLKWFSHNKIEDNFVIIDDDKSLNDLPLNLKNRLLLTSSMIGLKESHIAEIQNILDKNLQNS
jgi:hypothetical protein